MAKCIQDPKTKKAERLEDDEAAKRVAAGARYISKSEFRRITTPPTER